MREHPEHHRDNLGRNIMTLAELDRRAADARNERELQETLTAYDVVECEVEYYEMEADAAEVNDAILRQASRGRRHWNE